MLPFDRKRNVPFQAYARSQVAPILALMASNDPAPVGFLPTRRKLDSYRQGRPRSRAVLESVVTVLIVAVLIAAMSILRRHYGLP
jgi:hypothetical protein